MKKFSNAVWFLTLLMLSACSNGVNCTTEFRYFTVAVQDSGGNALLGAEVETVVKANGESLSINQELAEAGEYIVIDDSVASFGTNLTAGLKLGDNELNFRVSKDGTTVEKSYTSRIGLCHVESLEGDKPFIFN